MTESEAIRKVRFNMSTIGLSDKAAKRVAEARNMAINALEKQEKIKDLLDSCTAYPDDMCDCLVEIEKILRSDEEWKKMYVLPVNIMKNAISPKEK